MNTETTNKPSITLEYRIAAERTGNIELFEGEVIRVRAKNNLWTDLTLTPAAQERLWLVGPNLRVRGNAEELRAFFKTIQPAKPHAPSL